MYCGSLNLKRHGKTSKNNQRFRCSSCLKSFVFKRPDNKRLRQKRWFELWITESDSVRRLSQLSGHSEFKIKQIKNYWLSQTPIENFDYSNYQYLLFDGTYFHKQGCLMILMDALTQNVIFNAWADKESYSNLHPLLLDLKAKGLNPRFATMDGHLKVMHAFKDVWPQLTIQRCLYHIQRQGLSWLRTFPKTQAAKELRQLLLKIIPIQSFKEQSEFREAYSQWLFKYQDFVKSLPSTSVAFKDLKRTMSLVNNTLADMFHYLKDRSIEPTTNKLESFYSRLKSDIRRHRGLSENHKKSYLHWYCYFKNKGLKNNTF